MPIASRKALPDIPGIKRKENAINPYITKEKAPTDASKPDKFPIATPIATEITNNKEKKNSSFLLDF